MKFHFTQKRNIFFLYFVNPSFDERHCSQVVYINHKEHIFQELHVLHQEDHKKINSFCNFCHGVGTHLLTQTLVNPVIKGHLRLNDNCLIIMLGQVGTWTNGILHGILWVDCLQCHSLTCMLCTWELELW